MGRRYQRRRSSTNRTRPDKSASSDRSNVATFTNYSGVNWLNQITIWKPKVKRDRCIAITRWYPIVTTLMLAIGLLSLLFNSELYRFIVPLFGCAFFMSVKEMYFSYHYKFCIWHQFLLLILVVISLIAFLKQFDIFKDLVSIRILLLLNILSLLIAWIIYLLTSKLKCYGRS